MGIILAVEFTVAFVGHSLLEEGLGRPTDDDSRPAAAASVSLLVVVVAVAPRPHDWDWLGLRPGPGESLLDKPHSIILEDVGLTKCISGQNLLHLPGHLPIAVAVPDDDGPALGLGRRGRSWVVVAPVADHDLQRERFRERRVFIALSR